jgi:hypothetical protein
MCSLGARPHGEEVRADASRCAGKQQIRSAGLRSRTAWPQTDARCSTARQPVSRLRPSETGGTCLIALSWREVMAKGQCTAGDRTRVVDRADSRRWTGLVFATTAVVVAFGSLNSNLHARGVKNLRPVWHMRVKTRVRGPQRPHADETVHIVQWPHRPRNQHKGIKCTARHQTHEVPRRSVLLDALC